MDVWHSKSPLFRMQVIEGQLQSDLLIIVAPCDRRDARKSPGSTIHPKLPSVAVATFAAIEAPNCRVAQLMEKGVPGLLCAVQQLRGELHTVPRLLQAETTSSCRCQSAVPTNIFLGKLSSKYFLIKNSEQGLGQVLPGLAEVAPKANGVGTAILQGHALRQ